MYLPFSLMLNKSYNYYKTEFVLVSEIFSYIRLIIITTRVDRGIASLNRFDTHAETQTNVNDA